MKWTTLLLAILLGSAVAQDTYPDSYTYSTEFSTVLISIHHDSPVGDTAFVVGTYDPEGVEYGDASHITEYVYTGVDVHGTIHLSKEDHDYMANPAIGDKETRGLQVVAGERMAFETSAITPDIELIFSVGEAGRVSISLANADEFKVFND